MEMLTIVMELDKPAAGVTYPLEVVTPAVAEFSKTIQQNGDGIIGECNSPAVLGTSDEAVERSSSIDPCHASHIVKHIWVEGKVVKAKLKLIGKYAELFDLGVDFTVIPRLLGKVEEGVAKHIRFITLDLAYVVEKVKE